MRRTGIYPGTFDPVTLGHLDIIQRASRFVDELIVGVAANPGKQPLFTQDERIALLEREIAWLPNGGAGIRPLPFDGLLVDFAKAQGASLIIRGLRGVADFDFEVQLAGINSVLNGDVDTVFLPAAQKRTFISSSFVKDTARHGGDIAAFVGPHVAASVSAKFKAR